MAGRVFVWCALSVALLGQQLASCASTGAQGADGAVETSTEASASKDKQWSAFGLPSRARENPDFFLIWMKPWEEAIPKPIQSMIDQQVRPQTEQISAQIISRVPPSEQWYQQMSQLLSSFGNFVPAGIMGGSGGLGGSESGGGGGGVASMMQNLGRRR